MKKAVLTHIVSNDDQALIEDCKKSGFTGEIVVAQDFQVITI